MKRAWIALGALLIVVGIVATCPWNAGPAWWWGSMVLAALSASATIIVGGDLYSDWRTNR